MQFLRSEVESDLRLKLAKRKITGDENWYEPEAKYRKITYDHATVTDLLNKDKTSSCIFCKKSHPSHECFNARKMTLEEKLKKVREAKHCFKCLKGNHFSSKCWAKISCQECNGNHYRLMCNQDYFEKKPLRKINSVSTYVGGFIYLQILQINLVHQNKIYVVRALIDTGSERSYIKKMLVQSIGCEVQGEVQIAHSLFGGHVTKLKRHSIYKVTVTRLDNTDKRQLELLDVDTICGDIINSPNEICIQELEQEGIILSDYPMKHSGIDLLIGADIASSLYTGRMYQTSEGPMAIETKLGWTLLGKSNQITQFNNNVLLSHSLHVSNAKVTELWKLDVIGINDPVENRNRNELANSALKHFKEHVQRLEDGRYEVELPWIEGHQPVGNNLDISKKRLQTTMEKLQRLNKVEDYQQLLDKWLSLGIIEEVLNDSIETENVSYLPHHAVFNPKSSTTPIRPVFDASAKTKGNPSLNDCLEAGPNLIEFILSILIRFRMKQYGSISDVEKAFLQISIAEKDRNYLRFLWYKNGKIQIYRHCRVVFGIKSSPFLLAATLNYHLDNTDKEFEKVCNLLKSSTYVDNCVISVDTKEELDHFVENSKKICSEAKFNLRNWVWNRGDAITKDVSGVGSSECGLETGSITSQDTSNTVSVLGLIWNVNEDTFSLDLQKILSQSDQVITKRSILAASHKIFDPLGFVSPVTIVPKMLVQEVFKKKFKWDEQVSEEIAKRFKKWLKEVQSLQSIKIPRWVLSTNNKNKSLHVFTDASKSAYTAAAFLRSESKGGITIQLIMSKARVSTIKPISIPKLELIGCEIGAKLLGNIRDIIDMTDIRVFMWSDSSNALSWIKRNENWQVFVFNRVKKIREFSKPEDWRHIPGHLNPADLPSRGCTSKQFLSSRWWEGPTWLRQAEEFWPKSSINCDEDIVMAEKKRVVVSHSVQELESYKFFQKFSQFRKVVRVIAWMKRWKHYKRNQSSKMELTITEEQEAEICLWKMVQRENFEQGKGIIKQLNAVKDQQGLWRVKTKLFMRKDYEDFKCPILLPKNHIAVKCLIRQEHLQSHHSGAPILRSTLRERFWIINSRIEARSTVHQCGRCRRFGSRKFTAPEAPLPLNRVRDAAVFEVTGIDLGGPLYLIGGSKAWFVVFTCAVYRAIHLELVTTLSTNGFIQALRRFIARRGRPEVIYVDNGKNFVGTENLLAKLNWEEIIATSVTRRIKWMFNPPSAPW